MWKSISTTDFASTNDTAKIDDEIISVIVKNNMFVQPDAGAPGMKLAVQITGGTFDDTDVITTDSSDIVVGPVLVIDESGNKVTTGGSLLSTTFFINNTASEQTVNVFVDSNPLDRTFSIVKPPLNSGNFTGQGAGPHPLGNGNGLNGTRTVGGTIVLENLLIPAGTTINIVTTDIDPTTRQIIFGRLVVASPTCSNRLN